MVKKSLRTYQLYKQNLKIWFLFLLVSLLGACTQKQMLKPEQVSSIAPVLSWTQQSTPERIDDPNIPNCEPLELKPIKPEEIINIDDVVQNCSYETGHILYSDIGAWSNFPVIIDLWKWNITTQDSSIKDEPPLCEYWEEKYYPLKENESDIINFIKKYKIQENPYFNSINLHGELDESSVHRYFGCKESKLCKKLIDISYGANEKHYFFRISEQEEYLMIDNKKVYTVWNFIHNESDNVDTDIRIESPRVANKLQWDNLIVNKYTNGKLLEKYKSNPDLIDRDFEKTWKYPIIWTFQVKTCEIPLEKTL